MRPCFQAMRPCFQQKIITGTMPLNSAAPRGHRPVNSTARARIAAGQRPRPDLTSALDGSRVGGRVGCLVVLQGPDVRRLCRHQPVQQRPHLRGSQYSLRQAGILKQLYHEGAGLLANADETRRGGGRGARSADATRAADATRSAAERRSCPSM